MAGVIDRTNRRNQHPLKKLCILITAPNRVLASCRPRWPINEHFPRKYQMRIGNQRFSEVMLDEEATLPLYTRWMSTRP